MRFATSIVGAALLMMTGTTWLSLGQQVVASNGPSGPLKAYLRSYLSLGGKVPPDTTTRVTAFSVKTDDGKTKEYIVYLSGQGWCGSGGCTMLVLEPIESSFKVLGRVTIVQLPIRLLHSTSHGYPDIGVTVQGGGILSAYEAVLSFNGERYHSNPSLPPARKPTAVQGKIIISSTDESVPLYE
ncbi:hypothetical protein H7849_20065 [Alloacidobacterium dinghuense]|uniref:Lipoprotein n=1 Tax=Alloacidobacterium dinghuense TaxID=2763107 RepID=A0A7G8BFN6_9BACT|nr:hypothetical protein [Alloacidobacterium dinghuense]QNI31356.1 hypothetical protein H7849_20065 [Alloacidobacterium dinghuense]